MLYIYILYIFPRGMASISSAPPPHTSIYIYVQYIHIATYHIYTNSYIDNIYIYKHKVLHSYLYIYIIYIYIYQCISMLMEHHDLPEQTISSLHLSSAHVACPCVLTLATDSRPEAIKPSLGMAQCGLHPQPVAHGLA